MSTKAMNFKIDESQIMDMRSVGAVFNMTLTDIVREAVAEYIERLKQDPFYKLTANIQEASAAESEEILSEIETLSDDDLVISSAKHFKV